ncbi:PhzF family phenazine biosynthesis protein [Reinekea blandensis]|uniref:Uncharacterized protein n=1 Tax=Reinekea blandensis MED297 TaxID=314283 RepID=A4BKP7_9GAMM|nr:PhzF family phenazine biosynthesis protein [Reinekea blandensis]EAR07299.1 hypothetical protein MED297_07286 [Reinekea sp. MED297] [Reinekea blandensis MED297]
MPQPFIVADVFTDKRFGGNPLAVVLDADRLTTAQMQQIAREFNFSETTFVCAPQQGGDYQIRIFTPSSEVPFAGHPNIGTACVLAEHLDVVSGYCFQFEERAGRVPVTVRRTGKLWQAELVAPEPLQFGQVHDPALIAEVLSLSVDDLALQTHSPQITSVGLPFVMVELKTHDALQRARVNTQALDRLLAIEPNPFLHLYVKTADDEVDVRTRMFAPTDGVPEDPATGSANCALAAMLAQYDAADEGEYQLQIAQGDEMGRPSRLFTTITKQAGIVSDVRIAGSSVVFCEGLLR